MNGISHHWCEKLPGATIALFLSDVLTRWNASFTSA